MKRQEPVFRFHNPNSEKDTYNMLAKVFTNVGCRKLKEIIANADCNNADTNADGKD